MTSSDTVDVAGREENAGTRDGGGKGTAGITLPYVAQDNLELLTVELVERCLDLTYKGGDILGQHPDTGEDVSICSNTGDREFKVWRGGYWVACAAPFTPPRSLSYACWV